MKRYMIFFVAAVFCLVALDQGVKLIVEQKVLQSEELTQVADTLHLHPMVNTENMDRLTAQAASDGRPLGLYVAGRILYLLGLALVWAAISYAVTVYLPFVLRGIRRMTAWLTVSVPMCAASVCNAICLLLRGGSLDYICIARTITVPYGDHFHNVPRHWIFDLKDVYLWCSVALCTFFLLALVIDIFRFASKIDKARQEEQKQLLHAAFVRAKSLF